MGIKGLYSFIKASGTNIDIREKSNLRIGIDISYFMYRWGVEDATKYLDFIRTLGTNNNKVLFVFDGKPGKCKDQELEQRKAVVTAAETYETSLEEAIAAPNAEFSEEQKWIIHRTIKTEKKKAARPTKENRQRLKRIFYEESIHMLKSHEEADDLLVALCKGNDIDIVMSGDTDLLRLGAKKLWIPIDEYNYLEFDYINVLKNLNITKEQFQEMCILVTNNVDIRNAWTYIRVYGSIKNLMAQKKLPRSWHLSLREVTEQIEVINTLSVEKWIREDEREWLEAWRAGRSPKYSW